MKVRHYIYIGARAVDIGQFRGYIDAHRTYIGQFQCYIGARSTYIGKSGLTTYRKHIQEPAQSMKVRIFLYPQIRTFEPSRAVSLTTKISNFEG